MLTYGLEGVDHSEGKGRQEEQKDDIDEEVSKVEVAAIGLPFIVQ